VPQGLSKKLRIRAEEVAHLLRIRGCILTRDVTAMGFTSSQAKHTLKHLASVGRAVYIVINGVSIWCYSGDSAAKHLHRLRRTLHSALCRAGARFVTPRKALRILLSDEKASGIFSRYIRLSPKDTAVNHLIGGLLTLTYGDPVFYRAVRRPVYVVICSRKKLPPLYNVEEGRRLHAKLTVKVEPEMLEELLKLAMAKGASISELVIYAVSQLLKKYKAVTKPYQTTSIKLDAELKRDLMKAAKTLGVSTSELVRIAVKRLLERYKTEGDTPADAPTQPSLSTSAATENTELTADGAFYRHGQAA
jgi:Arc/MetJ-type ribon-helix-helix transcriptional regulator